MELGRSMYYDEKVPDSPATTPSNSQNGTATRLDQPLFVSLGRPHRNRRTTTATSISQPESIRLVSRPPRPSNPAPQLRRVSRRQPPQPRQPGPQPGPQLTPPRTPTDPQPPIKTIHLPEHHLTNRTSGYVLTQGQNPRQVAPFLVSTLECNIISWDEARRLGLEVRRLKANEHVAFDFGTGATERSVGRTTLQWARSARNDGQAPPFPVACHVCDNSRLGLVFGRPFVEERVRMWRRSSSGEGGGMQ